MIMNKIKLFTAELIHEITPKIHLPLIFCLFIELFSNFQILSLSLLPLFQSIPTSPNRLSNVVNHVFSYLEPFKIFDPFDSDSESGVIIILTLCSLYFVSYLSMIGFIAFFFQKGESNKAKDIICKVLSFITLIHSKIVFYFIHCFTVKALSSNKDFCSNTTSFSCTVQAVIMPAILFAFNVSLTLVQELFCYQIHHNKHAYGIKHNLHNFTKFFHKLIVIILLFFYNDPSKILIPFSIGFNLLDLFILHYKLPFYNTTMLKSSISCSTVSAFFAIVMIYRFFHTGENLCLVMIPIMPLIVKISLRRLHQTLWKIFSLKFTSPYHAVHLPSLIDDYLKKNVIFPLPDIAHKSTLYSMGFMASDVERIVQSTKEDGLRIGTLETQKAAYSKVVDEFLRMLRRSPQNELLIFNLAQIYSQVFGDSFKAFDFLNKIPAKNQSFVSIVCVKSLSKNLESVYQQDTAMGDKQEKRKNAHLSYFAYRHKINIIKKQIKHEIQDHLKLWKNFSSNELDILSATTQASLISAHTRQVTNQWHRNFEGQEMLYVNATLMYGLYLEIVQGIPNGGFAFIKKAYTAINNKWHMYRDVLDVALGNSAVIVASMEPDKVGKIIDASSSAKDLFKTTKQGLIGSNIAMVLPNVVASKHNDLIRGYQKSFKGNIDHNINSYAKTLQDEYFKVEVTLHVSPLTHKGLNLVSFIRKQSDYQSLMIVDPKGNIIEYSKDLTTPLNLYMKKSFIKVEALCPHFRKLNQAFTVLYHNENGDLDANTTNKRYNEDNNTSHQSPMTPKAATNFDSMMIPLASPTTQKLLSNSDNINESFFKSFRSQHDRVLSSNPDEPIMTHKTTMNETPYTNNNPGNLMSQEEAQDIWESFKNTQELNFYPLNKKGSQRTQEVKYKAEVEPFFFDKIWYRIIKMKAHSDPVKSTVSHQEIPPQPIPQKEEPSPSRGVADKFADVFPSEGERTQADDTPEADGDVTPSKRRFQKAAFQLKTVKFMRNQTISMEKQSSTNTFIENAEGPPQINMKKFSYKAQSVASSQATQKMTAKRLKDSLKMERPSASSKLVITMVYFTVIAIITSVVVHLLYTTSSLTEMQSSIDIIRLVNNRLAKTILNWQAMMVLYSRAVKLRPIDYRVPMYQGLSINASLTVLDNARSLAEELDKFQNADLIRTLYSKNIKLYEPLDGTLFDNGEIEQFSANQILLSYYFSLARYTGSYLDLAGSREFLFAINNTANDYMLTLERSVTDLSTYFVETKDENISLLKVITTIEILFVLSPLALILVIMAITIKTYSKLFQAIGKINENSLLKRVKQLEDISRLFEENLEDDISAFHKFKSQGLTVKAINDKKKTSSTYSKRYNIRTLTMHLLRYILIATALISVMITLVVASLYKSTEGFDNLDTIVHKALTVYNTGSKVRSIVPTFYIDIIFYNNTNYKIKNISPQTVLIDILDALDDAGGILLDALSDSNNELSDPVVKDILSGNVCKYITSANFIYCVQNTKGGAFGLMGLHTIYAQACAAMRTWIATPNPTWTLGVKLSGQYSSAHNNAHLVMFDAYDYLSDYLVSTFIEAAEENKDEMKTMFYEDLAAVLVSMFLIRVIVLTKLQKFDLGIRRILRVIPYRIIEENKVMSCYLAKTFKNELKVLKQMS